MVNVPISFAELIDKITILEIKQERIKDAAKLKNIRFELRLLRGAQKQSCKSSAALRKLHEALKKVNLDIWIAEDRIRECMHVHDSGEKYVRYTQRAHTSNEKRAAIKKQINELLGSTIVEEKQYGAVRKAR